MLRNCIGIDLTGKELRYMKSVKLWVGILGIGIAAYILFVSCYEAAWNNLTASGHFNGAEDDAGSILSLVLFAVASALAFAISPIYRYMEWWAITALVMAILSVIAIIVKRSKSS